MNTPDDVRIAGFKTVGDWQSFKANLVAGCDPALWETAARDYFWARLSTRYLDPIKAVQASGGLAGEGFSVVAIQCTLIEFLESTVQGRSYRYRRRGDPPLGPHEYSNSSDLFVGFLRTRTPFDRDFNDQLAQDFYEGVRCGVLHEARTKNGWTILADGPGSTVISKTPKIVYRNNFQTALLEFIRSYEGILPSDVSLQQAFIRKFDSLCQE